MHELRNTNACARTGRFFLAACMIIWCGATGLLGRVAASELVSATHSAGSYLSGGNATIFCTLSYTGTPSALAWSTTVPAGWTYVSGSGEPNTKPVASETGTLGWVWTNIPAGPISFSYALRAPSGDTGAKSISASVIYRADGQLLVPVAGADPLVLPQATYHTADYRAPFWQMDGTEVNRVLSYWRAGGYHRDAGGSDGFAPGPGATDGPRHAADFREALWVIDGTEVNRVLSYWRAGGYHPDTNGVDGFAPGVP